MTAFVDTNVLIYLLDAHHEFHRWAEAACNRCRAEGPLIISDIVYSEFSVTLQSVEATNTALQSMAIERRRFTDAALFRAGKAFAEYRRQGGPRTSLLSDFLIGAQAETDGVRLLTNDRPIFHTYFPSVVLIEPGP